MVQLVAKNIRMAPILVMLLLADLAGMVLTLIGIGDTQTAKTFVWHLILQLSQ